MDKKRTDSNRSKSCTFFKDIPPEFQQRFFCDVQRESDSSDLYKSKLRTQLYNTVYASCFHFWRADGNRVNIVNI